MTQDAARPKNKWMILAAAMDAVLFAPIEDTPGFTASDHTIPTITTQVQAFDSETSNQDDFDRMTLEEQMQQYDEECYAYFDDIDDDAEVIEIPPGMFDTDPTTETITHMPTMIEEEPNPPIIDNTTTTGDKEEIPIPPGMFDIDNEFTTRNTTEEEEDAEEESNPLVDNIRINAATTIKEAEKKQQQTRHTQSNDRPVSVISTINTNNIKKNKKNKKKKQKKATLKTTYMPAIIKEESNSPTTNNWIDDLTPRQKKALISADIAFIEQMKIEIQQQEQERQKWEQQTQSQQLETEEEEFSAPTTDDRSTKEQVCTSTTESSTTEEEEFEVSATTILESNSTTAKITKNQVMPMIIEDKSNHDEFTVSNKYYDSIDNEILQNEESTIVFEDNSLAPTIVHTDNPNNIIIKDLLTTKRFDIIVGLLNEDTLDSVISILSDNPLADHKREVVCGILMEALLSQNEVVGFLFSSAL